MTDDTTPVPTPEPQVMAAPPAPPRIWTVALLYVFAWAIVIVIGIAAVVAIVALEIGRNGEAPPEHRFAEMVLAGFQDPFVFGISSVFVSTALISATLLVARLSPTPTLARLGLRGGTTSLVAPSLAGAGLVIATGGVVDWLVFGVFEATSEHLDGMVDVVRSAGGSSLALVVLAIAFLGPIGEEILFRGHMQLRLVERWGPVAGIGITSVAFALLHFDPLHVLVAVPIGVLLGVTAHRAGSTLPALFAHVVNNGAYLVTTRLFEIPTTSNLLVVPYVVVAVISGVVLIRTTSSPGPAPVIVVRSRGDQ